MLVPAQQIVGQFLQTFREFPPSQKAGSFSLDKVMEALSASTGQTSPPPAPPVSAPAPTPAPRSAVEPAE